MTSTGSLRRVGQRKPSFSLVADYHSSDADIALHLMRGFGFESDPWQQDVLQAWLARDKSGNLVHSRCGLSVPRQNGKTIGVLHPRVVFGLIGLDEKILYTAHLTDTAQEAFEAILDFFESNKELKKLIRRKSSANGRWRIILKNGASIKFSTRSKKIARGSSYSLIIFDEAQDLTEAQVAAAIPTVSASTVEPQIIHCGTPPGADQDGEPFIRARKAALEGKPGRSWHEWGLDSLKDIYNEAKWHIANPSLGIRLRIKAIRDEVEDFSEDTFARERMGWWREDEPVNTLVSPEEWQSLVTDSEDVPADGAKVYAVKFSPDGATGSLVLALRSDDGKVHLELIEHFNMSGGLTWLADWLTERKDGAAQIVIDGGSAQALLDMLRVNGVGKKILQKPNVSDVGSASSLTLSAIAEKAITHIGQRELDAAALNVKKRDIGNSGRFGFNPIDSSIDITAFEAASLAYRSVMTTKRRPGRKQEVMFG